MRYWKKGYHELTGSHQWQMLSGKQTVEKDPVTLKTQTYLNSLFSFQIKKLCYCYLKYVVNCIRATIMNYVSALQTQTKRTRKSKQDISVHLLLKKRGLLFSGMGLLNLTFSNTIA